MHSINGIWQGKNAAAAVTNELSVFFFRIEPKIIGAVLKHQKYGVVGTVYGIGEKWNSNAIYRIINHENGKTYCNSEKDRKSVV